MSAERQSSLPAFSIYPDPNLIVSPICLPMSLPEQFSLPKFEIGQRVFWAKVSAHGVGRIFGFVFAQSVSVDAIGYHYAIALDENNPSRAECVADWAFEDDLELVSSHVHLLHR